jgi:S-adenosyl-L-methionine hydrolase (adenosine-forming)
MTRTIALLTDFGTSDTYVGVMKAVMAQICPDVQFIDLTHEIAPQNVTQGAFTLLNAYRYFAPGTVFLVVVDPGVGSSRRAIAVQADDYTFVAPDNGILSYTLSQLRDIHAVELTNPSYQLSQVSHTFHGRDIFAPAAAHRAAGVPIVQFGSPVTNLVQLSTSALQIQDSRFVGEVLYVDHFGNIITNIGEFQWHENGQLTFMQSPSNPAPLPFSAQNAVTTVNNHSIPSIHRSYSEVVKGEVLILTGSSGYLEIAVNQGSAARQLGIQPGTPVTLQIG